MKIFEEISHEEHEVREDHKGGKGVIVRRLNVGLYDKIMDKNH